MSLLNIFVLNSVSKKKSNIYYSWLVYFKSDKLYFQIESFLTFLFIHGGSSGRNTKKSEILSNGNSELKYTKREAFRGGR